MPNTALSYTAILPAQSETAELSGRLAQSAAPMRQIKSVLDWATVCTAPETNDGASDGTTVINPLGISTSTHKRLVNQEGSDNLEVRLKYPSGLSAVTSPVVEVYGIDGAGNIARLKTVAGASSATLAVDSTDVGNVGGTFFFTDAAQFVVTGYRHLLVAVKTKFSATGTITGTVVQGRLV